MFSDAPFEAFGWSHGAAIVALSLVGVCCFKKVRGSEGQNRYLRNALAMILLYSVISGPTNALLRFDEPWEKIFKTELPFFLCDFVSIVLALALFKKSQRLTEVGYVWAMAGTAQGLLTPVLSYDFPSLEYFSFFAQHGLAPLSAILLIWGFGLKPEPGAYKRVWLWTWAYMALVMSFNYLVGTNYGYLNGKPEVATAMDYLGDYPWYLVSLHGLAAILYWLLLLPFRKQNP